MKRPASSKQPQTTADLAAEISEEGFQAQVIELAETCGWLVIEFEAYRKAARGRFVGEQRSTGWPDLTLIRDRVIFRELKAQRGRVRPDQEIVIGALVGAGADVRIWRPSDWPEIERTLAARPTTPRLTAAELVCERVGALVQPEAGANAFAAWRAIAQAQEEK